MSFLIFSDLDGTLLDHHTYSFEEARPALEEVRRRGIPLILVSSKTRAEIEAIRRSLDNRDPFIVENGGGIFLPRRSEGAGEQGSRGARGQGECQVIPLGVSYRQLRESLEAFRREKGVGVRGFGDLSAEECARLCGLSLEEAALAQQREFDEPFFLEGPGDPAEMERFFALRGLSLTRGGRFFHLKGAGCDKGKAVKRLIAPFREESSDPLLTVGLGDSANDREMLMAVERPVAVKRPDGSYAPELAGLPGIVLAPAIGPAGWREAVLGIIGCPAPPPPGAGRGNRGWPRSPGLN